MIQEKDGTAYLKKLFDSCILLYVSQFGLAKLTEAAFWLFRMAYTRRLSNDKTVKETSIKSFVEQYQVFDHSFNHQQLMEWLTRHPCEINERFTDTGVKRRFAERIVQYFELPELGKTIDQSFDWQLKAAIEAKLKGGKPCSK